MTIKVNHKIFVWARETAGLSVEEAARRLRLTTSARNTAAEKLESLESGKSPPTRSQLNGMAKVYRRPLLVFYMAEPPRTGPRGTDFRQAPDTRTVRDNAKLDTLLRDVRVRQETVRDMLADEDDFEPLGFVGSITMERGVGHAVDTISRVLDFEPSTPRPGDAAALFGQLRKAAEAAGVFVLVLGDLGSYHSEIPASVFRGFAIADAAAPFVVINSRDARKARAFTLIHELAHVFLGRTGVSGSVSIHTPTTPKARVERFCNDVAGEFLLPGEQFLKDVEPLDARDADAARDAVEAIAARWSVSEPMVAYRLNRIGYMDGTTYKTLGKEYAARWRLEQERDRKADGSGPSARVMKQFGLGNALLGVVHRYVRENALSHTKAATLLGTKPTAVEPMLRHFEARSGFFASKVKA